MPHPLGHYKVWLHQKKMGERGKESNEYRSSFMRGAAIDPHSHLRWHRNPGVTDRYRDALGRVT